MWQERPLRREQARAQPRGPHGWARPEGLPRLVDTHQRALRQACQKPPWHARVSAWLQVDSIRGTAPDSQAAGRAAAEEARSGSVPVVRVPVCVCRVCAWVCVTRCTCSMHCVSCVCVLLSVTCVPCRWRVVHVCVPRVMHAVSVCDLWCVSCKCGEVVCIVKRVVCMLRVVPVCVCCVCRAHYG